jgi:hypothetical protein
MNVQIWMEESGEIDFDVVGVEESENTLLERGW